METYVSSIGEEVDAIRRFFMTMITMKDCPLWEEKFGRITARHISK